MSGKETPRSLRGKAYGELKELILSGRLRPAEKLSESALAKRIGLSRTPVREALMKLEEEGLVAGERNIGYCVADLDYPAVRDLLELRTALDGYAAELACVRADAGDIGRLRAVLTDMEQLAAEGKRDPATAARSLDLGIHIHKVIAAIARNDALSRTLEQTYQKLQLALWMEVHWLDQGDGGLAEHREIVEAIAARDSLRAAQAARAHVASSLENMEKLRAVAALRRLI